MPEDTMLNEAIEALRKGDQTRARDLLTRMLKVEQDNANYWVWMSAAVETKKEKIYCLQTALKLDPENTLAKRGLILFGARKADGDVKPFPINPAPLWKQRLIQEQDEKTKQVKTNIGKPIIRLGILAGIILVMLIWVWVGFRTPMAVIKRSTRTPGPSPTFTLTPTAMNAGLELEGTPTFIGPTPLWMLLKETYTPTPLYVVTQHPITSSDAFTAGIRYFQQGNWKDAIALMEQVAALETGSGADAWYYIGEANRLNGNNSDAKKAFDKAIQINPTFGVAYLGRAIVSKALDPRAKIINDLDDAIKFDPTYAPAYVERAVYFLAIEELDDAWADIQKTLELDANSSMAFAVQAELELKMENFKDALVSAQKANALDVTNLPVYLVLGRANLAAEHYKEAVQALEIYNIYSPGDQEAKIYLATGYNFTGDYLGAIRLLDAVLTKDKSRSEAYYQRGLSQLGLENYRKAVADFQMAFDYDPRDLDASIGIAKAYIKMGFPGDAYAEIRDHAARLAKTDRQKALVYYWEATALEELGNASAITYWKYLLDLPADIMPAEWRTVAQGWISKRYTATPVLTETKTPIASQTPTPNTVPTKTP
jgi:tetratricopeptide (TPR) repeat protein